MVEAKRPTLDLGKLGKDAVAVGGGALMLTAGFALAGCSSEKGNATSEGTRTAPTATATARAVGGLSCSGTESNFQNITPAEAAILMGAGSLPNFQKLWEQASGQQAPCEVGNIVESVDLKNDNADLADQLARTISGYYGKATGESPYVENFGTSNTITAGDMSIDLKQY
jgi:hypothetical protein